MDIKVWLAIDIVAMVLSIAILVLVAPVTWLAFVPQESMLPIFWAAVVGIMASGGLGYEIVCYAEKYGF